MAASNLTGLTGLIPGTALDFASAPLSSLVRNPLTSTLQCAQFEVQNSGRVNTSILETEQIQLKPGSLLTAITLGESIEATSACDGISFLKAGAVALSCGAAAQLSVGNPGAGSGVVFDTAADTVTVTGPLTAQWARSGVATIAVGDTRAIIPVTGVSNSTVAVATIKVPQGGSPDSTALYVAYIETLSNQIQVYVNAAPTDADITVAWAILSL